MKYCFSGFSDEISDDLNEQIRVVKSLGMEYISLRGINGKNIGDFTAQEFETDVLPVLNAEGIKVSSIGSPIGKVFIDDEEGFKKQMNMLRQICEIANMLDCKYIRMFSFFIKKEENYDDYEAQVVEKLKQFVAVAEKYKVILLHENEKDIFGDIARRCAVMFEQIKSPYFKAIFDFANFVQCGEDTLKAYEIMKEHIVYFHIKDASYSVSYNVLCGTGDGKTEEILKMAFDSGYEGFLTLEPHLAMFGSLKDLELDEVEQVVNTQAEIDGATGYKMQYEAIKEILNKIGV